MGGPTEMKHVKHEKYILPADQYIKQIPDYAVFGRKTTLRLNPDKTPDLHWNFADSYHTTNIGLAISSTMSMSTNYVDISTLSYTRGNKCKEWCSISLKTDVNILQSSMRPTVYHAIDSNKDNHKNTLHKTELHYILWMGTYYNPLPNTIMLIFHQLHFIVVESSLYL